MKSLSYSLMFGFFQTRLFSAYLTNFLTLCLSLIYGPAKGGQQLDIQQEKMPIVQRSIYLPYPSLSTISGAQQILVPAYVLLVSSYFTYLASPKSVSLAQPFSNMRIFQGFKSRYIIFIECRYSIPRMRHPKMNRTAGYPAFLKSSSLLDFQLMREKVSPPCAHSITKQRYFESLKAQCRVVMKLHLDQCNIFFQSLILEVSFLLNISDFGIRLMAYFSFIPLTWFSISSPKKTSPKPPHPILWVTLKCYHFIAFLSLGRGYFSQICLMIYSSFYASNFLSVVGISILGGGRIFISKGFYFLVGKVTLGSGLFFLVVG